MTMTTQDVRDLLADSLPHENKDFLQSIREAGQDDGPFMQGALLVFHHIFSNYAVMSIDGAPDDE